MPIHQVISRVHVMMHAGYNLNGSTSTVTKIMLESFIDKQQLQSLH